MGSNFFDEWVHGIIARESCFQGVRILRLSESFADFVESIDWRAKDTELQAFIAKAVAQAKGGILDLPKPQRKKITAA